MKSTDDVINLLIVGAAAVALEKCWQKTTESAVFTCLCSCLVGRGFCCRNRGRPVCSHGPGFCSNRDPDHTGPSQIDENRTGQNRIANNHQTFSANVQEKMMKKSSHLTSAEFDLLTRALRFVQTSYDSEREVLPCNRHSCCHGLKIGCRLLFGRRVATETSSTPQVCCFEQERWV